MRAGLAIERIDQDRAGGEHQHENPDRVERITAERTAQQRTHASLVVKVGGIDRYRSLRHVFSP